METDNQENTIFEIHSNHRFVNEPHHANLLVKDARRRHAADELGEKSVRPRIDDGNATPAPEEIIVPPFLRITTDHPPIAPEVGYMFGSDESICDILLAQDRHAGVSKRQFSLQAQVNSGVGVLIIKNYSGHGTCVSSPELKQIKLDSQRAISHLETEILVEIGNFQFRIVFPDRSGYEARWERHWSTYLATYGYQGEQVETFALSEGSTIASKSWEQRYRIYTTLGHGAFGTVYRVVSRKVGDHYAIKTFHERDHLGELNLKLLQSLNHDNIVQFYEVCQNPPSLIMELVCGIDLYHSYTTAALDRREIRGCARQLASAIAYLHSKGIVHRDLKPENIMVHRRSPIKLKLVDFGLATEKAGTLHSFGGTLRYMAPEMEQTKSYTKAVDVWALGVIMLELSYGLRRGSADGPHTYPERHYRHIREQSPNLLQEYITSLLRWNPRNRPSAAEAREALFARQGVTSEIWNTIVNARNANTSLHREGQVAAPVQNSQESTVRLPEVGRSVLPSGATTVANTSYKDGEREGAQNTLRPLPIQEPEGPSQAPNRETSHKSPRGQGSDFSFTDYAHEQRLAARQSRSLESPPSSPPYCPAAIAISRPALEAAQNDDNPTSHLNPEQSSVSTVDTWHRIAEQAIRDNYAPTPGGTFYRRRGSYYRDGAAGPESLASTESSSTRGVKRPAGAHPSTAMLRPVFSTTANVILDYGSLRSSTQHPSRSSKSTEDETEHGTSGGKA